MTARRVATAVVALLALLAVATAAIPAVVSRRSPTTATEQAYWACAGLNVDPGTGVCIDSPFEDPTVKRLTGSVNATLNKIRDKL